MSIFSIPPPLRLLLDSLWSAIAEPSHRPSSFQHSQNKYVSPFISFPSFWLKYSPALSGDSPTQRLSKYLPTLPTTHNIAVFVGAMARGRDDFADAYVDEKISISEYALSASVACGKVIYLFIYFSAAVDNC